MSRSGGGPARRLMVVLVPLIVFVLVLVSVRLAVGDSSQDENPFEGRPPYVDPGSAVAGAASTGGPDADVLARIAEVPAGVWLTPEQYPVGEVGDAVGRIVEQADEAGQVPVLVVYGIPGRDCSGLESAGGLEAADDYRAWVEAIGGAAGRGAVVVLEPDALATAEECGRVDERTSLLREAVDLLVSGGPTVYVDAGHASWTEPATMAAMLRDAGVENARGFATNVSGYEGDDVEQAYAQAVSDALGGSHWVTDTSRNGNGSDGQWCNPTGRALGQLPGAVDDGTGLDANLWVKPPAESDGECNGGPAAGELWVERAVELARAAGW